MEMMAPVEWSTTDTQVLQVLANVLASQNREAKAASLLEFALNHEPENPEVLKALSGIYLLLERNSDALEMIDRYVKTGDTSAGYASVLLIKAQALWGLGHEPEAVATIKEYLSQRTDR